MENKLKYRTYDIGLAGALFTAGASLIELDRSDYKKVGFVFFNSKELNSLISDYWEHNLQVDARAYFENSKMLKTRIFSEK